ncbi:MAG TPA: gamma-glutamyl-gamma-aminobutyrate hydrolase family protein [Planctomycetota bacterium]|jgi:GMP synthase (glutamine-hydrolysing)
MSKVLVLQHVACETPGIIADALESAGLSIKTIRCDKGERIPRSLSKFAGLVVMGGPQSVYEQDKFPFLKKELHLIWSALDAQKPILGVCLGSQLLAAALGAEVRPGKQKEIGWFPVKLTKQAKHDVLFAGIRSPLTPLHWHGDVFDLPAGATRLASSDLTSVQAFRFGSNAYGLLFHLEVTAKMLSQWTRAFRGELKTAGLSSEKIQIDGVENLPRAEFIGQQVFRRWAKLCLA